MKQIYFPLCRSFLFYSPASGPFLSASQCVKVKLRFIYFEPPSDKFYNIYMYKINGRKNQIPPKISTSHNVKVPSRRIMMAFVVTGGLIGIMKTP